MCDDQKFRFTFIIRRHSNSNPEYVPNKFINVTLLALIVMIQNSQALENLRLITLGII
jgi:hypothetical protein